MLAVQGGDGEQLRGTVPTAGVDELGFGCGRPKDRILFIYPYLLYQIAYSYLIRQMTAHLKF